MISFKHSLILTTFIVGMAIIAPPAFGDIVITGCDQGKKENYFKEFPKLAIGNIPDKIANWEFALAKGKYTFIITSYYDFIPLIYTKVNGNYQHSKIKPQTKMLRSQKYNRNYYLMKFNVNHVNGMGQNFWLLQIKPKPQHQNRNHKIYVHLSHDSCSQSGSSGGGCQCPPGSYEDTNYTWGQSKCFDRSTGKEVQMVCTSSHLDQDMDQEPVEPGQQGWQQLLND